MALEVTIMKLLILLFLCVSVASAAPAHKKDLRRVKHRLMDVIAEIKATNEAQNNLIRGLRSELEANLAITEERLDDLTRRLIVREQDRDITLTRQFDLPANGFVNEPVSCGDGELNRFGWNKSKDVAIDIFKPQGSPGMVDSRPTELLVRAFNRGPSPGFIVVHVWCELRP